MTPFPAGIQFLKTLPNNVFSKLQLPLGFDIARRQVSTVTARILAHLTSVFSLIFFSSWPKINKYLWIQAGLAT